VYIKCNSALISLVNAVTMEIDESLDISVVSYLVWFLLHSLKLFVSNCSSHARATATCSQKRPKQGERESPSKRHLKVTSKDIQRQVRYPKTFIDKYSINHMKKQAASFFFPMFNAVKNLLFCSFCMSMYASQLWCNCMHAEIRCGL